MRSRPQPSAFPRTTHRVAPALLVGLWASSAVALPQPQLTHVFPLGLQRGATVEITLAGADLEGVQTLVFSNPKVTAKYKTGLAFDVTAAPDADLGPVDVRGVGTFGVSNPRTLWVGDLVEKVEVDPNDLAEQAVEMPLNGAVSGRMNARADVDYYRFKAAKGQRVLVECQSFQLDSRLNPVVTVFGPITLVPAPPPPAPAAGTAPTPPAPPKVTALGRRVARARGTETGEAVAAFDVPADGEYAVLLHDLTYEGSVDYFYRLSAHTRP
ncbi:MAG: hypothetical protein ACRDD1_06655, partial [Planctomycetia bacterium]